jgi:hypothetical protein
MLTAGTLALLMCAIAPARGDLYTFTYSDGSGNAGNGTLDVQDSGLGDGSYWAVSGSLVMTGPLAGTYSVVSSVGPGITEFASTHPGTTLYADNLVYDDENAASGVHNSGLDGAMVINNPSYLSNYGLLFDAGSTDIRLYGTGDETYALQYTTPGGSFLISGATFVQVYAIAPEPNSLTIVLGVGVVGLIGYTLRRRPSVQRTA